jgi:hypothetical protein
MECPTDRVKVEGDEGVPKSLGSLDGEDVSEADRIMPVSAEGSGIECNAIQIRWTRVMPSR